MIITSSKFGSNANSSDDVLFGKNMRIIFQNTNGGHINIVVGMKAEKKEFKTQLIEASNGGIKHFYADIEIPFRSSGLVEVVCKIDNDKQSVYRKKITYVNDVFISFDKNVKYIRKTDKYKIDFGEINISHVGSFLPLSYSFVPYKVVADPVDYVDDFCFRANKTITDLGEVSSLVKKPFKTVNGGLNKTSYFNVNCGILPTNEKIEINKDGYKISKGAVKSFINEIDLILKSAIHNRTNIQEKTNLSKRYLYISEDDFSYSTITDNEKINIAPYMDCYFGLTSEQSLNDMSMHGDIEILSVTEKTKDDHTSINFNIDGMDFKERFSGYFPVKLKINERNVEKKLRYKEISKNIFDGCFLFADINGVIECFDIVHSDDRKITIKGNHLSALKKAKSILISFFNPTYVIIKRYDGMEKQTLCADCITGNRLVYKMLSVKTMDGMPKDISFDFYNKKNEFYLNKSIV